MNWDKNGFMISDDRSLLDIDRISRLLSTTYWASNRPKETIERSIVNSICFGLYDNSKQIGFARVVSDKAVFSWVLDVVIDEGYRGKGLGKWLVASVLEHPEIKNTAFALATSDAQDFYRKFNFSEQQCMRKPIETN